MPILKFTFFFRQRGSGWSESWYKSTPGSDLSTAYDAYPLAVKRAALCGKETFLEATRYSFTDVERDSLLSLWGDTLRGYDGQESDAPTTALLLRCSTVGLTARKFAYLRGIWDNVVKTGGLYTPTGPYVTRMSSFTEQLAADELGWLGAGVRTRQKITGMVLNSNGTVSITFAGDLFGAGPWTERLVRISGVACGTFPNGSVIMQPSANNAATTVKRIRALPWLTGGRGTVVTTIFRVIGRTAAGVALAGVSRVVERKTGRAFFVSAGRRRAMGAA